MLRKLIGKLLGTSKKSETKPAAGAPPRAHGQGHGHGGSSSAPHGGKRDEGGRGHHGGRSHDQQQQRGHGKKGRSEQQQQQQHAGENFRARDGAAHAAPSHGGHGHGQGHGHGHDVQRSHGSHGGANSGGSGEKRRRSRGGRGRGGGRGGDRGAGHEHAHDRGGSPRHDDEPRPEEAPLVTSLAAPRAEGAPIEIPPISPDNEFSDLGLEPAIAAAVEALGFTQPTPIQSEAIPHVLAGRDVIGSAQTGTGKTAAFGLPIMQKLGGHGPLRCLVLEPTRELALQVDEAFRSYSKFTDLRTAVIFGGVGYGPQRDAIARGLDIMVATPGRLLDHLEQGTFSLKGIHFLVLDEVDRMLDMGFLPDVKRIIEQCPKERQTLFFSATIPPELEKLTSWVLRDPHTIEIGRRRSPAETVSHAFYPVIESQKFELLKVLLERTNYDSVLIFCRTKHGADFVANRLESQGHKVAVMHANRSQSERMEALKGFKSGKYEVMVATDVAARGLDIAGISHVINYDTPLHAEDYVHRIGRTGRAQSEGDAFTLLTEEETKYAASIEHFIGQKVERKKLEDFPYQYSAVFASLEEGAKNVFRSRLYRGTRG